MKRVSDTVDESMDNGKRVTEEDNDDVVFSPADADSLSLEHLLPSDIKSTCEYIFYILYYIYIYIYIYIYAAHSGIVMIFTLVSWQTYNYSRHC